MTDIQNLENVEVGIFTRQSLENTSPNLEIFVNSNQPATKSKIKVGDVTLQGVETCDIHIDANHEIMFATLKVIIKKLHTE